VSPRGRYLVHGDSRWFTAWSVLFLSRGSKTFCYDHRTDPSLSWKIERENTDLIYYSVPLAIPIFE